jgi:hypothetical protein
MDICHTPPIARVEIARLLCHLVALAVSVLPVCVLPVCVIGGNTADGNTTKAAAQLVSSMYTAEGVGFICFLLRSENAKLQGECLNAMSQLQTAAASATTASASTASASTALASTAFGLAGPEMAARLRELAEGGNAAAKGLVS